MEKHLPKLKSPRSSARKTEGLADKGSDDSKESSAPGNPFKENPARGLETNRRPLASATRPFPERKAVASVNKAVSYQHSAISKRQKLNADS